MSALRHKQFALTEIEKSSADSRRFTVTLYDASEPDRDGETIDLGAVFAREPITLQADHDRSVLRTLGLVSRIHVEGQRLRGVITFASEGVSEVADQVRRQVADGITLTVSIGFIGEATRAPEGYTRWTNVEILELSFVSIPSSPGARVDRKALQSWLGSRPSLPRDNEPVLDLLDDDEAVLEIIDYAPPTRSHRSLGGDPLNDPFAHRDRFDVDPALLRSAVAESIVEHLRDAVKDAVRAAINRRTGRVD
jgi:hypothetical protein